MNGYSYACSEEITVQRLIDIVYQKVLRHV